MLLGVVRLLFRVLVDAISRVGHGDVLLRGNTTEIYWLLFAWSHAQRRTRRGMPSCRRRTEPSRPTGIPGTADQPVRPPVTSRATRRKNRWISDGSAVCG